MPYIHKDVGVRNVYELLPIGRAYLTNFLIS